MLLGIIWGDLKKKSNGRGGGGLKKNGFSYLAIHLMDLPAVEPICLLSEVLGVWTVPFLPIVV